MSLTIYPNEGYDALVTLVDADLIIADNSLQADTWNTLDDIKKEIYIRIATQRVLNIVSTDSTNKDGYLDDTTFIYIDSCLPKACALMAVHDLAYGLSSEINPNIGAITKEKVGDLEVQYQHDYKTKGRKTNPFPSSVIPCLNSYGANIQLGGIKQAKLIRS